MLAGSCLLGGCSSIGYYWQAATGEYRLLAARQPIGQVLEDPATPAPVRDKLRLAEVARRFAWRHLDLPHNASYTEYADLHRRYVVWNVYATRPLSVEPVRHCFPIAGCVAYRGYFSRADAERYARGLQARGDDVYVAGVPAFSTLGHFADPVLSTMLRWNDNELIGTIFHELAHQKIYVPGDTAFNESYASFVQREGLAQWRKSRGLPPPDRTLSCRVQTFTELVLRAREQLKQVYAQDLPAGMRRARAQDVFATLRTRYLRLRDGPWRGWDGFAHWFAGGLNAAKLLPFALYDRHQPAFAELFRRAGRRWPRFFAEVRKLAGLPRGERDRRLLQLDRLGADLLDGCPPLSARRTHHA